MKKRNFPSCNLGHPPTHHTKLIIFINMLLLKSVVFRIKLYLILIRHLSMLPQAPRAWQTPTSWSIHSGMVLGSLHYGGFFDLTPPRGQG